MKNHNFNFVGGEELQRIGASFYVAYLYWKEIDSTKIEWKKVSTAEGRINKINKTMKYRSLWIDEIKKMNIVKLGTNKMGISGNEVIRRANKL